MIIFKTYVNVNGCAISVPCVINLFKADNNNCGPDALQIQVSNLAFGIFFLSKCLSFLLLSQIFKNNIKKSMFYLLIAS